MLPLQVIGATTPAATAILAFVLLGSVEKWATYAALIPVMLGIVVATGYEPSFHFIGFMAAAGGCVARAFKTVMQVVTLDKCAFRFIKRDLLIIGLQTQAWCVTGFPML